MADKYTGPFPKPSEAAEQDVVKDSRRLHHARLLVFKNDGKYLTGDVEQAAIVFPPSITHRGHSLDQLDKSGFILNIEKINPEGRTTHPKHCTLITLKGAKAKNYALCVFGNKHQGEVFEIPITGLAEDGKVKFDTTYITEILQSGPRKTRH